MSLGMSLAWRAKQAKQQYCERCELYFPQTSDKCTHCSELSDAQLLIFKSKQQETLQGNANMGKYFILLACVIGALLIVSFL